MMIRREVGPDDVSDARDDFPPPVLVTDVTHRQVNRSLDQALELGLQSLYPVVHWIK